jgi:hypothetical protein
MIATERDGRETVRDTITCCHCNGLHAPPQGKEASRCKLCDAPICDKLKCYETCAPFEKKLEAIERRDKLLRAASG